MLLQHDDSTINIVLVLSLLLLIVTGLNLDKPVDELDHRMAAKL